MFVTVITCTYHTDNFQNLLDVVASLLNQTYRKLEIIVVIDGNDELYQRVAATYPNEPNIRVVASTDSVGVSGARDLGLRAARGEILAFIDDDAVADKEWIEGLVNTYKKHNALAVGGKVLPIWLSGKPDYLPEELYWLVGLTYEGYDKGGATEVRNALGCNMSFKKEVFERVGGFSQGFGFAMKGTSYVQGEEPELALRMEALMGKRVIYNPELIVYHKVQERKTRPGVLFRRAFYQGYSKALIKRVSPSSKSLETERSYLSDLLLKFIPRRVTALFSGTGAVTSLKQLVVLLVSIQAVGLGFLYGYIRPLPSRLLTPQDQQFPMT
jgi:GT2 family glycosyltransferase